MDYHLDLLASDKVLFATHCLMMIMCAILFKNPTMHNKVRGQTYEQSLGDLHLLTYQQGSCSVTNRLATMLIEPTVFQIPPCMTKLWARHEHVSLKSMQKVYCDLDF